MTEDIYAFRYGAYGNTEAIIAKNPGLALQYFNYINKGTAFTDEERRRLGLDGALPPSPRSLASQVVNSAEKVKNKSDDVERYIYIRSLFDRNATLAHALIKSNIKAYMGIIYTPTVGYACQHYSSIFRTANGIHFYPGNIERAEDILRQYAHQGIRVAVVTDNQGILGIGDQGAGGIAICLGKLMLYTQGAGIAPWHCLPISLDVGTNNKALLADDFYLGWRHERLTGTDYLRFVQRFAKAFRAVFPNALCQWEDFSKQNAFAIRDAYLHDLISFNDDIQGTGAITLAGILTAMQIKKEKLEEQVYLIHGAGAGGVGVAEQIETALLEKGLSREEARGRIYTLDSQGLVTTDRKMEPYKEKFAKDPSRLPWLQQAGDGTLENVVRNEKVTVLIGTSGQSGCFTREVVQAAAANTSRPVILPLSNPTSMTEALPADIYQWTNGQALVATGSPFPPVEHNGQSYRISQCNNVFVFPGVGLGSIASGAKEVLPSFFTAAAHAVSQCVKPEAMARGELLPPVSELQDVSLKVSQAVGLTAIRANVGHLCAFSDYQHDNDEEKLNRLITKMRWQPEYLPIELAP
ncbi:MAG: NAD-dependent malic enzyme [Deltaproteobacteria bacterium]|nr:NAD-dependent malic enzyme [Deltaproteobacteria bacterium]